MSEPTNQPQGQRVLGCLSKLVLLILILFLVLVFLAGGVGSGYIDAGLALVLGWIAFLQRTVPSISWNWDLIGMAALCVVLIALMGHRFASWVVAGVAIRIGKGWNWRWRWTWGGLAGLGLMFLVGMSVGGAAHQIGWIAGSEDPWFERKPRYLEERAQMRELEVEFRIALGEANTFASVRQSFRDSDAERRSFKRWKQSLLYSFHIFLVSTNGQHLDGIILFPRDPEIKSRLNGCFITDADSVPIPAQQLPELLKERASFLISF